MTKVGILGAAGYGGAELIRLLLGHPEVEIVYLGGHTTVGEQISDLYPNLAGKIDIIIQESAVPPLVERGAEVLCSALPHKVGAEIVAEALDSGLKVIDFSADFRLKDVAQYEKCIRIQSCWPRPSTGCPNCIGRRLSRPGWLLPRAASRPVPSSRWPRQ